MLPGHIKFESNKQREREKLITKMLPLQQLSVGHNLAEEPGLDLN